MLLPLLLLLRVLLLLLLLLCFAFQICDVVRVTSSVLPCPVPASSPRRHQAPLCCSAFSAVGEFRQLVAWAQEDAARCDQVKKMLKLTRGWEEARDHAMKVGQAPGRSLANY